MDVLTDQEKSMVGTAAQSKLLKPEKNLAVYRFVEGADGWTSKKKAEDLVFRANGNYDKAVSVQADGQTLTDGSQYTAWSGSAYVKLKSSYLKTLSVGKHTLTVVYTDGKRDAAFRLEAAPVDSTNAKTGAAKKLCRFLIGRFSPLPGSIVSV